MSVAGAFSERGTHQLEAGGKLLTCGNHVTFVRWGGGLSANLNEAQAQPGAALTTSGHEKINGEPPLGDAGGFHPRGEIDRGPVEEVLVGGEAEGSRTRLLMHDSPTPDQGG